MIYKIFHENSHYRNDRFQENRKNPIYHEFVKVRDFTLVIVFVIFFQKRQFRLKNENFEISGNTP